MFGHAKRGCGPQGFGGGGFGRFKMGPWGLLHEVNLTDDQLEKLAELKVEGLGKFVKMKFTMAGFLHQVIKEVTKPEVDKAKIREIANEAKAKHAEFADQFVERIIAFAEVLTAEQRKQLRLAGIKRFLGLGPAGPESHGADE